MKKLNGLFLSACLGSLFTPNAIAQSVAGVFGPVVNEGHKSAQMRLGFDPDSEKLATRVRYQQALNDDLMWRTTLQTRDTEDSDLDLNFVQAELFWQLPNVSENWATGFRFDGRVRADDRPNAINVHWMNQFALSDKLSMRAIVLTSTDVGTDAQDGTSVGTRTSLTYKKDSGINLGVEFHNSYGNSEHFGSFNNQNHQLGVFGSVPVADKWSIYSGVLFGVSDSAPDTNLKLWFTRNF